MITDTWELIDMVVARLEAQSGPLGLKFVGKYDEQIIPESPAVVVMPGTRRKSLHGLHTFEVLSELSLFVYHANLNMSKRERSKADLQLVSRIERELDSDMRWPDPETNQSLLINGYVTSEEPGLLQPRTNKSTLIICTRLTWRAISQRRF